MNDEVEIRFGYPCPIQSILNDMWINIAYIWRELEDYRDSSHLIYAGMHSSYSFCRRSPESVAAEIRHWYSLGKRNFLFECLAEGYFIDNITLINKTINLIPDIFDSLSIIYLSGAHDAEKSHAELCNIIGIPADRIKIMACAGQELGNRKYLGFQKEYVPGPRSKKFLCFNKTCRQHRIELLEGLLKLDLVKDAYYSFIMDYTTLDAMMHTVTRRYDSIIAIKDKFPLVLNITEERSNPIDVRADDLVYFDTTYFSLVTETLFFNPLLKNTLELNSHVPTVMAGIFPTEKIYKCLALGHPFIAASTPGFLNGLRERGYKTFEPFINESYDDITDDYERIQAILTEVNRLCNLSESELIQFTYNVKDIVDHNAKVFREVNDFRITKNIVDLFK